MLCMQYFLPFVFFPKPASSPWLTFSFLISLYLHHKPCLYCAVLFFILLYTTCDVCSDGCWVSMKRTSSFASFNASSSPSSSSSTSSASSSSSSSAMSSSPSASSPAVSGSSFTSWTSSSSSSSSSWLQPVHTNYLFPWP
ncbi:hypothetical protein HMI54_004486 [Coelomomyces lativittatus]|nr:hypothetical protein HMI54_004486 [Coelomomyces lativittatus]KAJ1511386.1 hypothetical protein HMI56_005459 [Coelomomyces lativittatus]KAJ1516921.1 hypothetical protein HMI55_001052 [Coelomomyces lativittatus]